MSADQGVGLKASEVYTRLRAAGYRLTAPRRALVDALLAAQAPLGAEELHARVHDSGLNLSTVYRNLMDLAESGLVARAELGDHVWRYEVRREGHDHSAEHPHFVCIDCGAVTCLTDVHVDIAPAPGSKKSTISSLTEVLLKGHCGKCV